MQEQLISFPTSKLAREKGFNEQCRHGFEWYEFNGKKYGPTELDIPEVPGIISFPPEERHHPTQKTLMHTMSTRKMSWPFFINEHLAPYLYARPSQDLLEFWFREVHSIHGFVEIDRGTRQHGIPPLYHGGYYTGLFELSEKWEDDKAFPHHRDARENWLYHALTYLI